MKHFLILAKSTRLGFITIKKENRNLGLQRAMLEHSLNEWEEKKTKFFKKHIEFISKIQRKAQKKCNS